MSKLEYFQMAALATAFCGIMFGAATGACLALTKIDDPLIWIATIFTAAGFITFTYLTYEALSWHRKVQEFWEIATV